MIGVTLAVAAFVAGIILLRVYLSTPVYHFRLSPDRLRSDLDEFARSFKDGSFLNVQVTECPGPLVQIQRKGKAVHLLSLKKDGNRDFFRVVETEAANGKRVTFHPFDGRVAGEEGVLEIGPLEVGDAGRFLQNILRGASQSEVFFKVWFDGEYTQEFLAGIKRDAVEGLQRAWRERKKHKSGTKR